MFIVENLFLAMGREVCQDCKDGKGKGGSGGQSKYKKRCKDHTYECI